MLFAVQFASLPSNSTVAYVSVLCLLAWIVGQMLRRLNCRASVAQLLRVTDVAKQHRVGARTAIDCYPSFKEASKCLKRAIGHLYGGNVGHAEELYRQAVDYLCAVDTDVMQPIMEAAKGLPLPDLKAYHRQHRRRVPMTVSYTAAAVHAWNLELLLSRIGESRSCDNDRTVILRMAPQVVQLLEDGGEFTAYERLAALKVALEKVDARFAARFMTAVADNYLAVIHQAHSHSLAC